MPTLHEHKWERFECQGCISKSSYIILLNPWLLKLIQLAKRIIIIMILINCLFSVLLLMKTMIIRYMKCVFNVRYFMYLFYVFFSLDNLAELITWPLSSMGRNLVVRDNSIPHLAHPALMMVINANIHSSRSCHVLRCATQFQDGFSNECPRLNEAHPTLHISERPWAYLSVLRTDLVFIIPASVRNNITRR